MAIYLLVFVWVGSMLVGATSALLLGQAEPDSPRPRWAPSLGSALLVSVQRTKASWLAKKERLGQTQDMLFTRTLSRRVKCCVLVGAVTMGDEEAVLRTTPNSDRQQPPSFHYRHTAAGTSLGVY